MDKRTCSIDDCTKDVRHKGLCRHHYNEARRRAAPPCAVDGCEHPAEARGWCSGHYTRWRRYGDPRPGGSCLGCGGPVRSPRFQYCGKPECKRLRAAASYQANRERRKVQDAARYARNRDRIQAVSKQWRERNPDKARAILARYKARTDRPCCWPGCTQFAAPRKPYCREHHNEDQGCRYARNQAKKAQVLYAAQDGLCPDADHGGCGLPLVTATGNDIDHIIPRARGGPESAWNFQLMHPACNSRKQDFLVPAAIALAQKRGLDIALDVRPAGRHHGRNRKNAA